MLETGEIFHTFHFEILYMKGFELHLLSVIAWKVIHAACMYSLIPRSLDKAIVISHDIDLHVVKDV